LIFIILLEVEVEVEPKNDAILFKGELQDHVEEGGGCVTSD